MPLLVLLLFSFFLTSPLFAQTGGVRQFQRQFIIGGRLSGTIILVGWSKDAKDIERLFDIVISKANNAYASLDWQNPSSDVSRLILQPTRTPIKFPEDAFAAFEAAQKVSKWTEGVFDIAFAGSGNWKDIKINKGSTTVELKTADMKIRFDQMINGFMAELIARYLFAANMQNAIVKVGNVFRGLGQSVMGPWKIEIQDDEGIFAHHALNLTVTNTGVSTVSAGQYRSSPPIDARSKSPIPIPCKGVVTVTNDAGIADGLAHAIFTLGPDEGLKLLSKVGKGLIVDNSGKFIRSPGF